MARKIRRRRGNAGFTIIELAAVASVVSTVPAAAFMKAKEKAVQTECLNNLSNLGKMVQLYEIENGEMPRAAFYPANPLNGNDSIRQLLTTQGDVSRITVCPAMPEQLLKKGLTFVYNDELGGQAAPQNASKKWILTEFTCVSSSAPAPHPNGWNFAFADGHVSTHDVLPRRITDARAELEKDK